MVDLEHHVNIRTAVADVNDAIARHAQGDAQCVYRGDLAVARGHSLDRFDLARVPGVAKPRADNVIRGDDSVERRAYDLLGRCRDDIELEAMALNAVFQQAREQ